MMSNNKSLPPTPKVIPKSVKMAGATTTKSIKEAFMKFLGSPSLAKAIPIGSLSSGQMPKVKPQLAKMKVDEEEYEADEDVLDDDSHDVGQPIEEEELEADEDQNEEQMIEVVPADEKVVDEEASDDEEANEGSGNEVYSGEEGSKLHAADKEDEADIEGLEEGINGYILNMMKMFMSTDQHMDGQMDEHEDEQIDEHIGEEMGEHDEHVDEHVDEQIDDHISERMDEHMKETHEEAANWVGDHELMYVHDIEETSKGNTLDPTTQVTAILKICTEMIMKRFDAMQHSMQQALAELQQTFIRLQRESKEAIMTKIIVAQTKIETENRALFQNHLSQALGGFEHRFINTLSLSYTTFTHKSIRWRFACLHMGLN
ncbi:hypothetical protein Sjap_005125 [Stephania japonica]|uniref:Uncharacterized protein n=1 Tax=Stephania japonica TaxID=461633 RepID=A0AAP0PIF8_9MAGN